ncbi:MAG: PAS domain-containing protein [Deltaproteobacteria bacterium]|nr:PAS domain-containing protein [Deltaproteobacteria bacterium]
MAPYKKHELFTAQAEQPTAEINGDSVASCIIASCNDLFLQLVNSPKEAVVGHPLSAFIAKFESDDGLVTSSPISLEVTPSPQTAFIKPWQRPPVCVAMTVRNGDTASTHLKTITLTPLTGDVYQQHIDRIRRYEAANTLWHVAVWDHDHPSDKIFMSELFREIYKIDVEEELTFQTAGQFIHPDDRNMEAVLRAHDPSGDGWFDQAFRIIRRDGEVRWLHSRSQTLFGDVNGKPGCVRTLGAMVDFTDEYLLKAALEENKQKLADILDSLPSMVLGVDANGCITQWNQMTTHYTGIDDIDASSSKLDDVFPMLRTEMPRIMQALADRSALWIPRIAQTRNNATSFFNVSITPTHNSKDFRAVVRVDDVTEQVRIEQMLVQSEKLLSVGGLAAGMAHEINNPLAAVIQSVQVVQSRLDPHKPVNQDAALRNDVNMENMLEYLSERKILRMINTIEDAASRAASIVSNMLGFVRISTNRHAICNVKELIDTTIELATNDYDLKRKYDFRKIRICREYDERHFEVFCDAGKIQQVLLNLIRNAGQAIFTASVQSPKIVIRIQQKNEHTRIEFEDNGPGVPDEVANRIFEPFFTTKPAGEGTGLGLSISYSIITKEHKGNLRFEKGANGGAKFIIELPTLPQIKSNT